jgi:hypothetical protein
MKKYPAFAVLSLLSASLPCVGDTFILKDGSSLEATIVNQEGDHYVLDVQVTQSIKDTRTIAKADVLKIQREGPGAKEFAALQKLLPAPDFLSAEDYRSRIASVEEFLKKYPESTHATKAESLLESLKAESADIVAGGIKFKGQIIKPAEYRANAYELDARIQEVKIRKWISDGNLLAALRAFSEFDQQYRPTQSHAALVPLIRQVIQSRVAESRDSLATLEERLKSRQLGLERMSAKDRPLTEAAIKEEDAALDAAFAASKDAKIPWPVTSPYHKPSLEETVRFGESELTRLASLSGPPETDAGKAFREAYQSVHHGSDPAAATASIAAAKTAGVPDTYLASLEEVAKSKN